MTMTTCFHAPRDENGWHIPAEGTLSRRIYELLRDGKMRGEILHECVQYKPKYIDFIIWKLKRPDEWNAKRRRLRARRFQKSGLRDPREDILHQDLPVRQVAVAPQVVISALLSSPQKLLLLPAPLPFSIGARVRVNELHPYGYGGHVGTVIGFPKRRKDVWLEVQLDDDSVVKCPVKWYRGWFNVLPPTA